MWNLTPEETRLFKKLRTPQSVQDFLDTLPFNFEEDGEICRSPRRVLCARRAHCIEGALFTAAVFWFHGARPFLLDLVAEDEDMDHVVAPFRQYGRWGAVSKTNHAVLRYREPVYRTFHELAMSYFHEYFLDNGKKTMRSYSRPFDLRRFGSGWVTAEENLWHIGDALDASPHIPVFTPAIQKRFRRAYFIEIEAGKLTEWKKNPRRPSRVSRDRRDRRL